MFTELSKLKGLVVNGLSSGFEAEYVSGLSAKLPLAIMIPVEKWRSWSRIEGSNCRLLPCGEPSDKLFSILPFVKRGMLGLGIQPYECAYLTIDPTTIPEAIELRLGTILFSEASPPNDYVPDFQLGNKDDLNNVISGSNRGYYAEAAAVYAPFNIHGYAFWPVLPDRILGLPIEIMALGRYFSVADQRSKKHLLSRRILDSKSNERQDNVFASIFSTATKFLVERNEINCITRVPPRPNKVDRLARILGKIDKKYRSIVRPEILRCIADYPSQKGMGAAERWANVEGKFASNHDAIGKHVLLFDDIMTIGATLGECSRALLAAGCSRVTVVVLGVTQRKIFSGVDETILCNSADCGGKLALRFRNSDGNAFWGCENYSKTNCKSTLSYISGWRRFNELNTVDNYEDITDVEF